MKTNPQHQNSLYAHSAARSVRATARHCIAWASLLWPAAMQAQGVPAPAIPVDCHMFVGYQGFSGAIPQCFIDSAGQGTILLNGSSRLNWQGFQIGGTSNLQGLTINSGGQAVAIVDGGSSVINGALSSNGRLGLFSQNISVGAGGSINAPTVLLSALPAANADQWISTGETIVGEPAGTVTSTDGLVNNRGIVRASQGNLTIIGSTVQNEGRFHDPALLESTNGDLRITAAGRANVTNAGTTALAQPATTIASINNYGTMRGFTVHLQAVPRYVPGLTNFAQINITSDALIQSSAGSSGVHLNTQHPTQPLQSQTALQGNSTVITPNAAAWPTSANIRTHLVNDGEIINPQEDDAPTAPAAPLALPRLSSNQVVSTNSASPPLAATYSSLNALPKNPTNGPAAQGQSAVATRGTTEKKPRKALVKGAFFSLQYQSR
jgi:hypothetical protein